MRINNGDLAKLETILDEINIRYVEQASNGYTRLYPLPDGYQNGENFDLSKCHYLEFDTDGHLITNWDW